MARLVIDDIEDDVVERLRERAIARSQSLSQAAREIILRAVPMRSEASRAFRQIRAMTPPGQQEDSTAIIRRMRDDRS